MDQSKFRKVTAMLGSDADGEVLAAARLMRGMAEGAKMTITEALAYTFADLSAVFGGTAAPPKVNGSPAASTPQDAGWTNTGNTSRPAQKSPLGQRQDKMMEDFALCWAVHSHRLSKWEYNFTEDVVDRWESGKMHNITTAQEAVINRIISKCGV